jgi:hypothetical protein
MSGNGNSAMLVCSNTYEDIYGNYQNVADKEIVSQHFGEFSQALVNEISTKVEENMLESGDKKGTVKKMFSVLVEGLQNIRIHGEKDKEGNQTSFMIIGRDEDEYLVTFGNLIKQNFSETLDERLKDLNDLEEAEVKSLYMDVLTNGIISNKGGAGLGFITMVMKSKNKLRYNMAPIDNDLACFSVEVKIDRVKKKE